MNKKICIWVCVLLTFIMFFANMGTTYSATVDTLYQQKSELQNKLSAAEKEINKLKNEMSEVQWQISQLNSQIDIYQGNIENLQNQINDNEAILAQLQEDYEKRGEALADRIVAQYEAGDVTYLDFLLSSESLTDFISNYYVLGELADMDNSLLREIETSKENIEKTKQQLESDKASVEEQMNIVKQKVSELENNRKKLSTQKASIEEEEKKYKKEIEQVEKKIEEIGKSYVGSFSGTLSWPLSTSSRNYNLITYGYGPRNQPVAGASVNHKALDIGVNYVPLYAPADGYIVCAQSGYFGYGNFIQIKHSNNLYTCYGHLSKINVSVGQTVKRGQQIGVTGGRPSDGYKYAGTSSGPHLHFEVRTGVGSASRVNPLNYITGEVYSKLIFCF